ncbi:MAG: hypothetical protein P4L85_16470 [Paludisphaera borealis]|uniref:hypothetical protein n=1 Tax=Paludisphaera borealis TaxID=1387353 RepID=UPI002846A8A4|nr:hypothetical protein [Paludisphaera borealis]MDR3620948.1 hypothetical protein [Paludisphaera borealis]
MADADLYRIQEIPSDVVGGASGTKRIFRVEFIGKAPNERFPYTIANEVVAGYLGSVLGFQVPIVIPYLIDQDPLALILWMSPAAREQDGPPLTSRELHEFLEADEHRDEIHGAIVLDLFVANTDRSFGPERRNLAVDEKTRRLILFDFGNALFYRNREHLQIEAGVTRLEAVEADLGNMFDKAEKDPRNYYFQLLESWELVEKWCQRIRELPDFILENAVNRIPPDIEPPTPEERRMLVEFLKKRRGYLLEHIESRRDLFPSLPPRGSS